MKEFRSLTINWYSVIELFIASLRIPPMQHEHYRPNGSLSFRKTHLLRSYSATTGNARDSRAGLDRANQSKQFSKFLMNIISSLFIFPRFICCLLHHLRFIVLARAELFSLFLYDLTLKVKLRRLRLFHFHNFLINWIVVEPADFTPLFSASFAFKSLFLQ